jgi:hypothetical protein
MLLFWVCGFALSAGCKAPHTVLALGRKCVCRDGYPYGDPDSAEGCFRCQSQCHSSATCQHPGKCVCDEGYDGDGVSACELVVPEILSIAPAKGPMTGGTFVFVQYQYSLQIFPTPMCRFGSRYVDGILHPENNTIACLSPPGPPVSQFLSISFNGIGWSRSQFSFAFEDVPRPVHHYERKNPSVRGPILACLAMGTFGTLILVAIRGRSPDDRIRAFTEVHKEL